jgi:hypothetical protein
MANGILIPLLTSFNGAGIDSARRQLGSLGGSLHGIARAAGIASTAMIGYNAAIGAARFASDAVIQARDFERNMAALSTVFGSLTPTMTKFVQASEQIGLSQTEAAKSATFLGSVLKQAGLPMEDVAGQTESLVRLATDLATTYGYSVPEALTGMTALFRGEYDPIEKFGVAMKQSEVNAVLAANGQKALTGEARRNAEQMARLALLYERSADAQGAFARQGDSLFVKQAKLTAVFTNFKRDVGEALIPVLSDVAEKLVPIIKDALPSMVILFKKVADVIAVFTTRVFGSSASISPFVTVLGSLLDVLKNLIPILTSAIVPALALSAAYKAIAAAATLATGAATLLGGASATTGTLLATAATKAKGWVQLIAVAGAAVWSLADAMIAAQNALPKMQDNADVPGSVKRAAQDAYDRTYNQILKKNPESSGTMTLAGIKATDAYNKVIDTYLKNQKKKGAADAESLISDFQKKLGDLLKGIGEGTGDAVGAVADTVKTLYSTLNEEVRKQTATNKLTALGASGGLISTILGVDNWQVYVNSLIKGGSSAVAALQNLFNQTAAGVQELADKQAAQAEKSKAAAEALAEYKAALAELRSSFKDLIASVAPLPVVDAMLGRHEQAVVSAFDAISESIASNAQKFVDSGRELAAYASKEKSLLLGIAKQRDVLAKKIDIAKTVAAGILEVGNITSMLQSETKTVTEKTVGYVGNLLVTVTRELEQTINGSLTESFRSMLAKTKEYAANLKTLKALGLNGTLFKQIVDAGVESGGATASAIIAGGADAISELNGLFADLNVVAADVSATTTDVMYAVGEDVANAFIDGLLAQDMQLQSAAERMAAIFSETFQRSLGTFSLNPNAKAVSKLDMGQTSYNAFMDQFMADTTAMGTTWSTNPSFGRASGSTINVTVNAGLGTDGATVGSEIVNVIKKYERTNGSVWVAV